MSGAGTKLEKQITAGPGVKLRALVVEDDPADAELMLRELRKDGFDVSPTVVQTPEEFRRRVKEEFPDIVLADYNLGEWRGDGSARNPATRRSGYPRDHGNGGASAT